MTITIDELNTRYLIPGVEMGTTATADLDGAEDDYRDAPYSQMPAVTDMPSPTGWQDLLGLNQVSPGPSQIDPPPRPPELDKGASANGIANSLRFLGSVNGNDKGSLSAARKVERMIGLLAAYDQAARRVRARASEGGGR